ncbi:hypothetical protein BH10PSE17_BH10PSE17_26320 [soil metagenome]
MDKAAKLLVGIDLNAKRGAEIGALDKPIIPPTTPGVCYFDYLSTEELLAKYRDDPNVTIPNVVPVSHVWRGEPLESIVGPDLRFDYIVASHVIEHVPDLVGWLRDLVSVLAPGGQIRLAVPDRRYCFDLLRQNTQITDVLIAHIAKAKTPQPRAVVDWALHVADVECLAIWRGEINRTALKRLIPPDHAIELGRSAMFDGAYHDVHCWTFTPLSFARLMRALCAYGLLSVKCASYLDTDRYSLEFFVNLEPCDDADEVSRSWTAMENALLDLGATADDPRDHSNVGELKQQLEATSRQLEDANAKVAALLHSTSWRVTAPMRLLKTALNGLRRP